MFKDAKRRPHRHGERGLHSSRKFSSAELQLAILALLDRSPSHGYELIKSLEEISDGYYAPSPGMIYPALTYLEELGLANSTAEGSKRRYELTSEGRRELAGNEASAQGLLKELADVGARMADARRAFAGELDPDDGAEGQSVELRELRRRLRGLLRGHRPKTTEDDARVVSIITSALEQIANGYKTDPDSLMRAIANRRSMGLSRLKPDPVDRRLIEKMLEAANWAPSHGDTEPWRFSVFMGDGREALAEIFESAVAEDAREGARKRAFAAPVWISIGMTPKLKESGEIEMTEREEVMAVTCAAQNLHLMASALGLAGMWHSKGLSINQKVAEKLGLIPPSQLLGFFMCGWPSEEWPEGERGPIAEKTTWFDSTS